MAFTAPIVTAKLCRAQGRAANGTGDREAGGAGAGGTCLSHITAPRAWSLLFERILAGGETAGLANAAINLPLGLLIVAFHNVWSGWGLLFTLIGYALLLKGSLHLLVPGLAQRSLKIPGVGAEAEPRYRLAGVLMLPLALLLMWIAFR